MTRKHHPGTGERPLRTLVSLSLVLCLLLSLLAGCGKQESTAVDRLNEDLEDVQEEENRDEEPDEKPIEKPEEEEKDTLTEKPVTVKGRVRPQLLDLSRREEDDVQTPSVTPYALASDRSNLINQDQFYLSDEGWALLEQNLFLVRGASVQEFFEIYEQNRYGLIPNFVTVDSMMHTYHLYFSLLLNRTEKNYLSEDLLAMSEDLLAVSTEQYKALQGTEWEEAALRNVAFFAVAAGLQGSDAKVPGEAAQLADQEIAAIEAASELTYSPLACDNMDYTQYKPRGYYAGDDVLEPYFRAMMWYGQVNFNQKEDTLTRSALLMTLAMDQGNFAAWEKIYLVTSFFAGVSDDLGYYEYAPAIEAAYGQLPEVEQLVGDERAYNIFVDAIANMAPPAINSVPVDDNVEDVREVKKGFRFMGQRFTIDAAIMQQLVYKDVKENDNKERRMLPDFLDVPAALGSELAEDLLRQTGVFEQYPTYGTQLEKVRQTVAEAPEKSWSTSLYSSWLYTLNPLLLPKGEGYPSFMQNEEWLKKDLETYAGSFTELKHDTVLYAKQMMAEMGGGPPEPRDDRGYVEPETEVFRRFMLLAKQTAQGLDSFGYVSGDDLENLSRLGELAEQLMVISQKELREETLTDEEYELIRAYGGTLEHFWAEAVREKAESDFLDPKEIPASLVTDIATDPNGTVLEIGTGNPDEILVIVPVDGQLRIASGMVFDFYQFTQPIDQRLTDKEWRQMLGQWMNDDGEYDSSNAPDKPWWTTGYRIASFY